jgi:HPt (histidine-containing phosphotransfer) domain-containing protein
MSEEDLFYVDCQTLDPQVLGQIELLGDANGVDLVAQLATQFLAEAGLRVVELHQAIVTRNSDALVRSAHNLNGAGAMLGATSLSRLCAALEAKADSISPVLSLRFLGAIESEIGRVASAFNSRGHGVI